VSVAARDPLRGLTFDEASHTYRVDGRRWPSVTQVLDRYSGLEHVDAEVLRRAAEFGTHVHAACHLYNEERLDWDRLDPALLGHVRGWQRFLEETGAVVLSSECKVLSRRHGFCGTLDARAVWGRERGARLIDIKSTNGLPITTGPQTAGYLEAWHEMTGERMRYRYCCHLTGNGEYRLHPLKDPRDWERFKAALVVHQWLHMPKEKP
jgi:hypothetical protein